MGFFEGWWSAGDDMLRCCMVGFLCNSNLEPKTALDDECNPAWKGEAAEKVYDGRAAQRVRAVVNWVSARSDREGMLCLNMVSRAVGWRCACHCWWMVNETRGRAEVVRSNVAR